MSDGNSGFRLTESQRANLIQGVDADALERLVRLMPADWEEALLASFTRDAASGTLVGFWGSYNKEADQLLAEVWAPTWEAWGVDEIEHSLSELPGREIARARLARRREVEEDAD